MALLIDGYNLLHVTSIFGPPGAGTELHRTRLAFLNFLASSLNKRERKVTTIVFDGAGAPPGLPESLLHDGITVRFARRHSNADEMIEEMLETWRNPRALTVVSSDHRVQRAARHAGATFVDSERWYTDIKSTLRARNAAESERAKPSGRPTPEELDYWVSEFSDTPPDDPR